MTEVRGLMIELINNFRMRIPEQLELVNELVKERTVESLARANAIMARLLEQACVVFEQIVQEMDESEPPYDKEDYDE